MSSVTTADGVALHCEEGGKGTAVLFVHEYGGSCRSFDRIMVLCSVPSSVSA